MHCYNITDTENIKVLAEMIAMETAGCTEASIEKEDVELAVIAASFIKQLVKDNHVGCVIRGEKHHD